MLTVLSYGEIISSLLAFHWFFLIICLSRKVCKIFKVFSRGSLCPVLLCYCAICSHYLFFGIGAICRIQNKCFSFAFFVHAYIQAREWEIYIITWSEFLSKIYSINFSQDFRWISILCLRKKMWDLSRTIFT